jgi:hypothetical protein
MSGTEADEARTQALHHANAASLDGAIWLQ